MNKQEFDDFANDYRTILKADLKKLSGFGSEYFAEYKINIINNTLKQAPKRILDFGCGDGICCEYFRKYFSDSAITGIDVSSESIKIAQNKKIENTDFFICDNDKLPFEDDSFDLIFVACVFHHIEKQKHASLIKELNRVLTKQGKVFVFEHNPLNPFTRKCVRDCIFDKNAELIGASSLREVFLKNGFKTAKINYTLFFPRYNLFNKFFSLEKYFTRLPVGAQYYLEASNIY